VLFVALMGWHVGMNAGSTGAALLGVLVTMVGIMTPSTVITYTAARWGHRNRDLRAVRAFKQGMAPIVIALLLSTAWIMASSVGGAVLAHWPLWLTVVASGLVIWRWAWSEAWWQPAAGAGILALLPSKPTMDRRCPNFSANTPVSAACSVSTATIPPPSDCRCGFPSTCRPAPRASACPWCSTSPA
jgi:chromate transport protein ChrA